MSSEPALLVQCVTPQQAPSLRCSLWILGTYFFYEYLRTLILVPGPTLGSRGTTTAM